MGHGVANPARKRTRAFRLFIHLLILVGLLAVSVGMATLTGGLWPFDLRFSALIAAGGIAMLAIIWWPAALAFAAIAALLPRTCWRLAFWPLAVLAMVVLHATFGPRLGFAPLGALGIVGALRLYAIPVALPILAGSALRAAFSAKPAWTSATDKTVPPRRKRNTP